MCAKPREHSNQFICGRTMLGVSKLKFQMFNNIKISMINNNLAFFKKVFVSRFYHKITKN